MSPAEITRPSSRPSPSSRFQGPASHWKASLSLTWGPLGSEGPKKQGLTVCSQGHLDQVSSLCSPPPSGKTALPGPGLCPQLGGPLTGGASGDSGEAPWVGRGAVPTGFPPVFLVCLHPSFVEEPGSHRLCSVNLEPWRVTEGASRDGHGWSNLSRFSSQCCPHSLRCWAWEWWFYRLEPVAILCPIRPPGP